MLTYEQADEIFMASEYADELDDIVDDCEGFDGYAYQLEDGSLVVVKHDGTIEHEDDSFRGFSETA